MINIIFFKKLLEVLKTLLKLIINDISLNLY